MADRADGEIVVDTELDSTGFKAGSAELLTAIKSLSSEIKELGKTLKETFGGSDKNVSSADDKVQALESTISSLQEQVKSLQTTVTELQEKLNSLDSGKTAETPVDGIAVAAQGADEKVTSLEAKIKELEGVIAGMQEQLQAAASAPADIDFDTNAAEAKIAALENKVSELEATIATLQSSGGTATPTVSMDGTPEKVSGLQRQIDAVNNSVERLGPTFQRAMNGSESAISSFEAKADTLDTKISELREQMSVVADTEYPTEEYTQLCAELDKVSAKLDQLYAKEQKMRELGVSEESRSYQSLIYDLTELGDVYVRLSAQKQQFESSGGAFQVGADTAQYAQMEASLSAASSRLAEMRAGLSASDGIMRQLGKGAKSVFSWIGKTASAIGGKLLSGIKSAVSGMARFVNSVKSAKTPINGLTSSLKRLAPALLAARGLMGILRKAVNAYMQENQQLSAKLNACWSGIGNILGPIIERLVSLVATAVAYVTQFLQLLGFVGKSTSKAISSAGGSAEKETDKLKRQLASFDELNILSDTKSGSGGGGASTDTGAELPDVSMPDWVKLMADQLKSGQWAEAATTLTTQLNAMVDGVDWAGIGSKIAYCLDGALTFLATAITTFDWYNLGASLGTLINNIIFGVDWANLGIVLGWKFIALIEGLGGLFSTIDWAALGKALADAFMGLWNAIDWVQAAKTLSTGIIGALNSLSSAIKNVDWKKLGKDVATYIANIDWSGVATALFDALGAALGGLGAFLWGLLEDAFSSIGEYFTGYIEEAEAAGGNWVDGLLQGIWDGLCNIGTWIVENVFNPIWNGIKDAFGIHSPSTKMAEIGGYIVEGLIQGITDTWSGITEFFSNAISTLGDTISAGWESIKTNASTAWSNIKTTVTDAWQGIKSGETYTAIKDGVSSAWTNVKSWSSSTWSGVKTAVSDAWSSVKKTTSTVSSDTSQSASKAWSSVKKYVSNNITDAKSTAQKNWENIKSTTSSICTNIGATVSSGWTKIKNSVVTSLNNTKSSATSVWNAVKSTVSNAASSINSTVSSKFSSVYSTINSKMSSVKNTVSSGFTAAKNYMVNNMRSAMSTIQGQNWYSVGSNICSGIRNGINAGWSWLSSTVSNLARNLLNSAKRALGIHSPSRVFRDAVGLNIGLGIGEGITDSENSVLKSVTGVADAIAEEVNAGEYEAKTIVPTTEINGALSSFSDKISGSFATLMERLQAIADGVTFQSPVVATGAIPYRTASIANGSSGANIGDVIESSNEELSSVIIQTVTQAATAIVNAIQEYSGTTVNTDSDNITNRVIEEINRKTRMNGKSPLLI